MVKLGIAVIFIANLFSLSFAQNQLENKISADSCVKILIAPTEKSALLLELNGDLFLASMKDIQSIDSKIISTILMYNPDTKECDSLILKSKVEGVELTRIFKINTKEGEKLPLQFSKKNK